MISVDEARLVIAGQPDYKGVVKSTVDAALQCVGYQDYGKYDIDTYTEWRKGTLKPPKPLNCWASVVFWAWQGNGVNTGWCKRYIDAYQAQVIEYMQKSSVVTLEKQDVVRAYLLGQLTSERLALVTSPDANVTAPIGRTIFFPGRHTGPLAHVALTLGGNLCVSNWRLPNATGNEHLRAGYTHIETIAKLANYVDPQCEIRITPKPFWELRMCSSL